MDLKGKNVIYIGGFGGIGQKCIELFLQKSIKHLFIFDLKENSTVLNNWRKSYGTCAIDFVPIDVTKTESIEAAYQQAKNKLDYIDVVVNGCGLMDDSYIDRTIDINLRGVIHSSLIALNYMDKSKAGRGGVVVNISSVLGLETSGMFAVYSAAKHGVTAFSRAMAHPLYFKCTGVNFLTICPGLTETALLDNIKGKPTLKEYSELMVTKFAKLKTQPANVCAGNLLKCIETNKLGSVWLLDLGNIKEVEMPVMWTSTEM